MSSMGVMLPQIKRRKTHTALSNAFFPPSPVPSALPQPLRERRGNTQSRCVKVSDMSRLAPHQILGGEGTGVSDAISQ